MNTFGKGSIARGRPPLHWATTHITNVQGDPTVSACLIILNHINACQ